MKQKNHKIGYKRINGKRVATCDYHGECNNKAYMEVYPSLLKDKKSKDDGWSYLCRKHYKQE